MSEVTEKERCYTFRLDFYWKAIAMYSIALLIYALIRGTIIGDTILLTFPDPFIVLLGSFVAGSAIALLVNWYGRREIIVGENYITFRNRFRERRFGIEDIARISVSAEHLDKIRGRFRIIKLRLHNRRRAIRIRPGSYVQSRHLYNDILNLRKQLVRQN